MALLSSIMNMILISPKRIFQEKDFLDFRYFHKRAYYLACIALGIQDANRALPRQMYAAPETKLSSSEICDFRINFAYQNDNPLQPIITVDPVSGQY